MNKTKIILSSIVVLALAGVVAFWVLRGNSDGYLQALPKDATALVRLDVKALLDEADLTKEETTKLLQRISFSEETNEIGIDFNRPVYGFAIQNDNFGILAAVASEKELQSWCERLAAEGHASEIMHQRGYSWVVLEQQWLMAFDNEKALVMGPAIGAAQDLLRTTIVQLMEQNDDESALKTDLYKLLKSEDEPLVALVRPELLPEDALKNLGKLQLKSSQQGVYCLTMAPDDNELEVDIDIISDDETILEELTKINTLLRPITGKLLDNAHPDNAIWLACNLKGEDLLSTLRAEPSIRTSLIALNLIVDVDQIIQAIDGDIAVELTSAKASPENDGVNLRFDFKNGCLTAHVTNTDFLSEAQSWGNSFLEVKSLSATDFMVNLEPSSIYFGVQDNTFYLSGEKGLTAQGNAYLNKQRSDIKGARFYATLNLSSIPLEPISFLSKIYPELNRLDIKMKKAGEFSLTLKASDRTNILRTLLQF